MRVVLIGGTVFIGRAIAKDLAAAGHELCFVHRGTHEPDDLPDGHHIHVDRRELATVREEIAAWAPDAAVDNIAMSRADAETAVDTLPDGLRLVVTSSIDVYRAYTCLIRNTSAEPLPLDESSPVRDERYPYRGQGDNPMLEDYEKLDVEEVYLAAGATVLRLPMVYGAHDGQRREEFVLRRVRAKRTRIPVGSGTWLACKGHVDDIARGMRLALESDTPGEIFNLSETKTYAMARWVQMILDAAETDIELVRVPEDNLPPDMGMTGSMSQHLLADASKARRVLGWTDTDPRETLRASVTWHLANPPETSDEDFTADDAALESA